jgi:hypothetical protein
VDHDSWRSAAQQARRDLSSASIELWNLRLDALRSTGDVQGILAHLATTIEGAGDNCSCNQGCNSCFETLRGFGSPSERAM